jgi:hypothetical protein
MLKASWRVEASPIERCQARARHPGVLLIPSLPTRQLRPLFESQNRRASPFDTANLFVEVHANGAITSFTIH